MKNLAASIVLTAIAGSALAQTPRITFRADSLYPEGVAYNKNMYVVSSVTTGTIGTVSPQGQYKILYQDNSLKSSFGMKADPKNNRLWICTGDPTHSKFSDSSTYKKVIRLIGLDINTGKKTNDIDLSALYTGKHFANDLTLDDKGNVYITDSYSPVIYKADASNKAAVFSKNDLFKGENVGLNGIVWSAQGFFLTINSSTGALLKVDANDPQKVSKVKINNFFTGGDGLLWDEQNNLILIQNNPGKIYQLTSSDNWQTAKIKATTSNEDRFQYPTTGIAQQGKIFVLNAKLNELDDPTKPPSKEFSLQLAQLKPAE